VHPLLDRAAFAHQTSKEQPLTYTDTTPSRTCSRQDLELIDAYLRAANSCRSEEGTTTPFDMVMLNNLDASASSPHPRIR